MTAFLAFLPWAAIGALLDAAIARLGYAIRDDA